MLKRHDFFHAMGCRLSVHGLEEFYARDYTDAAIDTIFHRVMDGLQPDEKEICQFKTAMLVELGIMDWEKGWAQQYHYGALRNNNSRMFSTIGPDTGYDSIGDLTTAKNL